MKSQTPFSSREVPAPASRGARRPPEQEAKAGTGGGPGSGAEGPAGLRGAGRRGRGRLEGPQGASGPHPVSLRPALSYESRGSQTSEPRVTGHLSSSQRANPETQPAGLGWCPAIGMAAAFRGSCSRWARVGQALT